MSEAAAIVILDGLAEAVAPARSWNQLGNANRLLFFMSSDNLTEALTSRLSVDFSGYYQRVLKVP